ncbi:MULTISPECIES: YifB family Mg chelatase-like AAA ATPase [unclassified Leucobacter]|uniref:YifB family Mg chelatase-like AAA ATPase n=1 Tax=unclassified Leucobacter TaxID=2621730 RepID=UPI00165E6757|nr:YifB family Mg chelatase-like AAA ATPase [Leucobacter sp. CX169]MBC9928035.1 YifB family Mg chelatase-like AAA ATPase [Leucobacter sp. cx-169]
MTAAVCRAATIALNGLEGAAVQVEAAVSQQLPGMAIIGLPDAALAEAKLRVRLATAQADLPLTNRFLTVNLAPAALPKQGSGFDLAIALASLAASAQLPGSDDVRERLASTAHLGELGLDGGLRRPDGLLGTVVAAQRLGFTRVMVPASCAAEAGLVAGMTVVAPETLAQAVDWYRGVPMQTHPAASADARFLGAQSDTPAQDPGDALDMVDVVGQPEAVEAMLVAAAGRHHLSLVGPPGAGKTLLATRLPSILPDLSDAASIEASSIASLGSGAALTRLVRRPPFESPHHTASAAAIIGGGTGNVIRPGAVTRACHGVLFLDEAAEFAPKVLDALRQPLESGVIEIHRARMRATLPASVQLILAANPCPCGKLGSAETSLECECPPLQRRRYLARISGPLADRIDLRLTVRRVSSLLLQDAQPARPSSAELRVRVVEARGRAARRLAGTPWAVNADVPGRWLRGPELRLARTETIVLDRALARGGITLRGYDRALKVAWTIADLDGMERPGRHEVARALMLRNGVAA